MILCETLVEFVTGGFSQIWLTARLLNSSKNSCRSRHCFGRDGIDFLLISSSPVLFLRSLWLFQSFQLLYIPTNGICTTLHLSWKYLYWYHCHFHWLDPRVCSVFLFWGIFFFTFFHFYSMVHRTGKLHEMTSIIIIIIINEHHIWFSGQNWGICLFLELFFSLCEFFTLILSSGFIWSLSDSKFPGLFSLFKIRSPGIFSEFWPVLTMLSFG